MKTLNKFVSKLAIMAFVSVMMLTSIDIQSLVAQENGPDGYCTPKSWAVANGASDQGAWPRYRCYPEFYPKKYPTSYKIYQNATIAAVKIYPKGNENEFILYNYTGEDFISCYQLFLMPDYEGEGEMTAGDDYQIKVSIKPWKTTYAWGYTQCGYIYYSSPIATRVYMDWNMDADWEDNLTSNTPWNEWINRYQQYKHVQRGAQNCALYNTVFDFKVPDDVDMNRFRIRITASMGYGYNYPWWKYERYYPDAKWLPNACVTGYYYKYTWMANYAFYYEYGETEDYIVGIGVAIKNTFPSNEAPDNILLAGEKYNDQTRARKDDPDGPEVLFKQPMFEIGSPMKEGTTIEFKIYGPLPLGADESKKLVYEALDPNNASDNGKIDMSGSIWGDQLIVKITKARGKYAPNGDGIFKASSGGEYELRAIVTLPGKPAKVIKKRFIVAWADDMMAHSISSPLTDGFPRYFKYARGLMLDAIAKYTNTGLNPVYKFTAKTKIIDLEGNSVYEKSYQYDANNNEDDVVLNMGESVTIDFGSFKPDKVGQYKMYVTVDLESANDMEPFNDRYMRQGEPEYTFAVADEYEAEAYESIVPLADSREIVAQRPFIPVGDFKNNGISDIADALVKMTFTRQNDTYTRSVQLIVESLPQAPEGKNIRSVKFPSIVLDKSGMYDAVMEIHAVGDLIKTNDQINFTFEVLDAIGGVFTVGTGGDFETIDEAMKAIYKNGINKDVVLELIDEAYTIGKIDDDRAAWDFSSNIMGLSAKNTITIRPSVERGIAPAGITINMYSGIGIGVLFGQNNSNRYSTAIINEELTGAQMIKYSTNGGFITIDGGKNKTFKFVMNSGQAGYSAAFALHRGSQNITVQNCYIENNDDNSHFAFVPGTYYSAENGNVFEMDISDRSAPKYTPFGFSAAFSNRATKLISSLQVNEEEQDESQFNGVKYDIIPNINNTIANNIVSGFGFGVLSIGMGPVQVTDAEDNEVLVEKYNENTRITGNEFTDLGSMGIFLGFEKDATVEYNLISGIESDDIATGIALGGYAHGDFVGYNNINANVVNNRISNLNGASDVRGIFVEQAHNIYEDPSDGIVSFPTESDDINIESNAIWNLEGADNMANIFGISILSERKDGKFGTLNNASTTMKGVTVWNNTVNIDVNSASGVSGLAINFANTELINNAITVKNSYVPTDGEPLISSALFFIGQHPKLGGFTSNYNVFYTEGNVDAVRFIEAQTLLNDDEEWFVTVLNEGWTGEFNTLRQWYTWTGQDEESIFGVNYLNSFTVTDTDITYKGVAGFNVLANRGIRNEGDHTDIHGKIRGMSDEKYDIGSVEFISSQKIVDYETTIITSPQAYLDTRGKFSDAEYLMTLAPISLSAVIRNNGSVDEAHVPVTFTVFRQTFENEWLEVATHTTDVKASAGAFATVTPEFTFEPESYAFLDEAVAHTEFYGMEENVTPLYKITVSTGSDEYALNNTKEQIYRFYIRKANEHKLVQSNALYIPEAVDANNTETLVAALNSEVVNVALKEVGMYNVSRLEAIQNKLADKTEDLEYRQDIDIFNRNAWPERSVDYSLYKTVVYADANDVTLTRYDKGALLDFIESGDDTHKKNLIIGSEEIVRNQKFNSWKLGKDLDMDLNTALRVEPRFPYSPLGLDKEETGRQYADYSGNTITGVNIGGHETYEVSSYNTNGELYPMPGLFNLVDEGDGYVFIGQIYDAVENQDFPEGGRIMSASYTAVDKNIVVLGVDWRHFTDVKSALSSAIDFMNQNGGMVNPIELYEFTAQVVGNRVELNWTTASEINSSKFDIERKSLTGFVKINSLDAKGNSSLLSYYNATDLDVTSGNTYTYRLKMIDKDGSFTYSDEKTVELDGIAMEIGLVSPNPVKGISTIDITVNNTTNIVIELYNEAGNKVADIFNGEVSGSNTYDINGSRLANGYYTLVIRKGNETITRPVTIVR